ncbi:SDR family NAD(P)-dependent oxidoreductase [Actinomycetospora callitridis]|uniref:SDR family NAD(P)-dependent oxidoreductase n=1 Tax=Actinomycetospora callitridis TaxID=913944 RepID=UPI00236641C6|nr:SDR family NAD(P)-dependent oxidoreductase [Actinomycetospora callitridis]MDD7919213.1 SDR family NAD(P)-dependent oxidoreductase [Actinomycetospora callitridis]
MALVLGASRGLGFLVAQELGRRGHDLAVVARSADGLEAARPDLEATGATVLALPADLSSRPGAEAVVETAAQRFGRLDVVVANAGIIQVAPLRALDAGDIATAHDAIFWSAVHPVMAALPILRRRGGGRIVVITSIGGKIPTPRLLPYTAAKFATVGFAESLRTEAGRDDITVTTVVPGLMRTGSTRNALVGGDREAELRWFTALASLPLLSMDAGAAARRIVAGGLAGRAEVVLTPAAKVGLRVHGIAPGLTQRALGLLDRLLPTPGEAPPEPGHTLPEQPWWQRLLTTLDRRAAVRHHELDDEIPRR